MQLILPALLSAAIAHANNASTRTPGISYGDSIPSDNTSYIDSFRSIYNATAHVSFLGPNITRPYPRYNIANWSLDLFVVADAEAAHSYDGQKPYYTAISIEMRGPESFRAAGMDNGWSVCNSIALVDANGRKAINGSCEGILSSECQRIAYDKARDCSASFFTDTEGCDVRTNYVLAGTIGKPTSSYPNNRDDSLLWRNEAAIQDQSSVRTERHDAGDQTAYKQALDQIYIVPVIFNHETPAGYAPTKDFPAFETRFVCLQATTFAKSSKSTASRASWSFVPVGLALVAVLFSGM